MIGTIFLLIALAVQIGYTGYCVFKKSYQPKAKHILRFSAFAIMVIFLLLGIIHWDFRWKPLFFCLSFMAILSLTALLRRAEAKTFRIGRAIVSGLLSFLLVFTGLMPALLFPPYTLLAPGGRYTVLTEEASYYDDSRIETYDNSGRAREVNVKFWYPDTQGEGFPLIIFDHGFCGIKDSNESSFLELASHGYVVCSIDHPYQSFYTINEQGETTIISNSYLQEYRQLGDDPDKNLDLLQKWLDIRVADANLVIDTILAQEGGLYSLIDKEVIGVFGHSLGGATATALARVSGDIDAVINLDGPMPYEIIGVEDGEYTVNSQPYPVPILNIYSQYLYDNGIMQDDPLYKVNRMVSATAPAHYDVVLEGTQHMNLTDLVLFSPVLAGLLDGGRKANADAYDCLQTMNQVIVEFFDSTLKHERAFEAAGFY